MAKFVHVYHLHCGHTSEEPMHVFEREKEDATFALGELPPEIASPALYILFDQESK